MASGQPRVFHVLRGEALEVKQTPYRSVGQLFRGEGLEAVWISEQNEDIDRGWFSRASVDLIVVVQGNPRVEFERQDVKAGVLRPGDLLVLPGNTRCRAYRWPRESEQATAFVAVYPAG